MKAQAYALALLVNSAACTDSAVVAPDSASDERPTLRLVGKNVVRHTKSPYFSESSRHRVQGQRKNGRPGCAWAGRDTLRVGETRTEWVAEHDSVTCELVVARGTVQRPFVSQRVAAETSYAVASNTAADEETGEETPPDCAYLLEGNTYRWSSVGV
jgi:hypothetical protein